MKPFRFSNYYVSCFSAFFFPSPMVTTLILPWNHRRAPYFVSCNCSVLTSSLCRSVLHYHEANFPETQAESCHLHLKPPPPCHKYTYPGHWMISKSFNPVERSCATSLFHLLLLCCFLQGLRIMAICSNCYSLKLLSFLLPLCFCSPPPLSLNYPLLTLPGLSRS